MPWPRVLFSLSADTSQSPVRAAVGSHPSANAQYVWNNQSLWDGTGLSGSVQPQCKILAHAACTASTTQSQICRLSTEPHLTHACSSHHRLLLEGWQQSVEWWRHALKEACLMQALACMSGMCGMDFIAHDIRFSYSVMHQSKYTPMQCTYLFQSPLMGWRLYRRGLNTGDRVYSQSNINVYSPLHCGHIYGSLKISCLKKGNSCPWGAPQALPNAYPAKCEKLPNSRGSNQQGRGLKKPYPGLQYTAKSWKTSIYIWHCGGINMHCLRHYISMLLLHHLPWLKPCLL